MRILLVIFLIVVALLAGFWFSSHSLPSWYQQDVAQQTKIERQLETQITEQGVGGFIGDKVSGLVQGNLSLNETEFNALLLSSLRNDKNGRTLLAVSDAMNAQIYSDGIEFGAVINLQKVSKVDAKLKEKIDQVLDVVPFRTSEKIYVAVIGVPVAKNGGLAFNDQIRIKIGSIPISNTILQKLGVPLHRIPQETLSLEFLSVQSVSLADGNIQFQVRPRF